MKTEGCLADSQKLGFEMSKDKEYWRGYATGYKIAFWIMVIIWLISMIGIGL